MNTQKYRLYNKKTYWDGINEGRVQKEDFNFLFKLSIYCSWKITRMVSLLH